MRVKIMTVMAVFLLFAAGCTYSGNMEMKDPDNPNGETQPINYKSKAEQYGQTENQTRHQEYLKNRTNAGDTRGSNTDIFTTDEAVAISDRLRGKSVINQAQVASTGDRIIIGVMLTKYAKRHADDQQIIREIETEVQSMAPGKEIIVYTDDDRWNQMKDLNASMKKTNADEKADEYIDRFIND